MSMDHSNSSTWRLRGFRPVIRMKRAASTVFFTFSLAFEVLAAEAVWVSAFDNTSSLPNGLINQRIDPDVMSLQMLGPIRFYRIDGGGYYVELAPYLGIGSTLQDHFNQPWSPTGFETDNYKYLSVDTGSRLTTIYISDDHDIVNPEGGPFIRQTQYPGTPAGIVTSGYTSASFWLDHGTATYGVGGDYNSIVYRMDILVVPEPSPLLLVGIGSLVLLMWRRRAAKTKFRGWFLFIRSVL